MLFRYFRREEMFGSSRDRDDKGDRLEERDVEDLLDAITRKDGFIRVDSLLAFFKSGGASMPTMHPRPPPACPV
jgi:hypothetical protein